MNHQNKAWWPAVKKSITMKKSALIWTGALFVLSVSTLSFSMCKPGGAKGQTGLGEEAGKVGVKNDTDALKPSQPPLDTALYLSRLQRNANGDSSGKWPVKGPYPNARMWLLKN
jgi:hypothetical protein